MAGCDQSTILGPSALPRWGTAHLFRVKYGDAAEPVLRGLIVLHVLLLIKVYKEGDEEKEQRR